MKNTIKNKRFKVKIRNKTLNLTNKKMIKLKVIPILHPNKHNKNPLYNKIKKIGKINMNKNYNKNMKEYLLIKNRINNLLIFNINLPNLFYLII